MRSRFPILAKLDVLDTSGCEIHADNIGIEKISSKHRPVAGAV